MCDLTISTWRRDLKMASLQMFVLQAEGSPIGNSPGNERSKVRKAWLPVYEEGDFMKSWRNNPGSLYLTLRD